MGGGVTETTQVTYVFVSRKSINIEKKKNVNELLTVLKSVHAYKFRANCDG